jgi:hypothetical protein
MKDGDKRTIRKSLVYIVSMSWELTQSLRQAKLELYH